MNGYELEWRFEGCDVFNTSMICGNNKKEAIENFIKLMGGEIVIGKVVKLQMD